MILTYAGITLDYITTEDLSFDSVPADDAQTQYWYTKVGCRVKAILHPNLLPAGIAGIDNQSPATILRDLKKVLKQHRQLLTISSDEGEIIVSSPADGKSVDAKNGPIVKRCRVRRMSLGNFEIDFEVETYIVDCDGGRPGKFASHRFSDTIIIDDNFYTTRHRSGTVVVWSDGNTPNPDDVKPDVIPPMRANHVRAPIKWSVMPDGVTARYEVTDREVYRLPPPGATKASGMYTEQNDSIQPFVVIAVQLRLEGPPEVDKSFLIASALRIFQAKFEQAGLGKKQKPIAGNISVSDDLWLNAVTLSTTATLAKGATRLNGVAVASEKALGQTVPDMSAPKAPAPAFTSDKHAAKQSVFVDPCDKTPQQPT